jgi:hypothetical protein
MKNKIQKTKNYQAGIRKNFAQKKKHKKQTKNLHAQKKYKEETKRKANKNPIYSIAYPFPFI